MPAYLVTGNPGSGKTTVALELAGRGFTAVDADEIAGWEDAEGRPTGQPGQVTDEWLRQHRWVWRRSRLQDAIGVRVRAGRPVLLCGIAVNQHEMLDCFDLVFLLSLDDATQLDRLDTPASRTATRPSAIRSSVVERSLSMR